MNCKKTIILNLTLVICLCRLLVQGQGLYLDIGALPDISFHDNTRIENDHVEFGFRPSFYLGYKTKNIGLELSLRSMHWGSQVTPEEVKDKEIIGRHQRLYDLLLYRNFELSNRFSIHIGAGPNYRGVDGNNGMPAVTTYHFPLVFEGVEYHPYVETYTYSDVGLAFDFNASIKIINDIHLGGRYRVNRFFVNDKYTSWAEFFVRVNIFK